MKKIKFLFDVGVSKKAEIWLKENGYDVKAVRDINPGLSDKEILKIAVDESRMIVTMDKDFGELIYNSGLVHSGVLLLRLEEAGSNKKLAVIQYILNNYSEEIFNKFKQIYEDAKNTEASYVPNLKNLIDSYQEYFEE